MCDQPLALQVFGRVQHPIDDISQELVVNLARKAELSALLDMSGRFVLLQQVQLFVFDVFCSSSNRSRLLLE
jgi:hypothetical protein